MEFFIEWNVERFGEQTNFENIDAEELNKKVGKFYAKATPQHKKGQIKFHQSIHQKTTKIQYDWNSVPSV